MEKIINFDMDGTITDLYGVQDWLEYLLNEDTLPYEEARPMVNFSSLARILNRLQRQGYKINIITWLSKSGSTAYMRAIAKTKRKWLKDHLPSVKFDHVYVLDYGTPKYTYGKGILFDDEYKNREAWEAIDGNIAYNVNDIIGTLKKLK